MAGGTGRRGNRKTRSHVVRYISADGLRAVPGRSVARHAVAAAERVIVVDVALRAGSRCLCASQRKARNTVVERSGVPALGRVAVDAIGGSKCRAGSGVYRVVGLLPGGQVTSGIAAVGGGNLQIVVVTDVAGGARHVGVAVGEQEARRGMVEDSVVPTDGVVTLRAVCGGERRARFRVHGIVGLLPGGQVAAGIAAVGGGNLQVVVVIDMAGGTGHVGMAVRERKSRGAVIKRCAQPTVELVTALTIPWCKSGPGGGVIRIRGVLPIFEVAGLASRGEAVEDACSGLLVVIVALDSRMSAEEREAVLVVTHLLDGDVPSLHRMALCAVRTHLSPMDVRMAIGAILANVGKDRLDVAGHAFHLLVHASERISGLVMVKLGNWANGAPSGGRVTVFAGNIQRAMRIASGFFLGRGRQRCWRGMRPSTKGFGGAGERQQSPESELDHNERIVLPSRNADTYRGSTVGKLVSFSGKRS